MWTEKTPAEDIPRRECPHDVVGLRAHKGTMWMSNVCVPLKNVESPFGEGVSSLPGAAGDPFPVAPVLLAGGPQLGPWQVAVVRVDETPAGDSSEQDYPCATQNRHRQIGIYELPDGLAHTVVEGGPVGPEVREPLELLVLDHADPAGQHAVIWDITSLLEHPLARPESSLGGGLVERISDGEPAARQVPDTTLDSRLRDGNTYLEHPTPGVSLDGGPMEGMSCLEPLEQSILHSSSIARPRKCVMKERSEWKPVINPAISYNLDGRPMEGTTYPEHLALGVSLDSRLTEGASCLEPLEQSVLSLSLAARPVEGVTEKVFDWKPVINPVISLVNLWRGLLTRSIWLWGGGGGPWTVDSRRRRCVWNRWSSGFLVSCTTC